MSGVAPRITEKSNRRGDRLIAFGWYGGKFSHLRLAIAAAAPMPTLLRAVRGFRSSSHQPENRPQSRRITMSMGRLNFFKVLRDQREELVQAIGLTPFSKREFEIAITEPGDGLSTVEQASAVSILERVKCARASLKKQVLAAGRIAL